MDERKRKILYTIIKEHVKTGAPVGSGILVDKYKLDISAATARNEMAVLEEEGYIAQPHTSAGRVPTEAAYRMYLDNIEKGKLNKTDSDNIDNALKNNDEQGFKRAAKIMAQASGNTVFWAFHQHNLYYTGISNLFHQPEFREVDLIYNISAVIDRFDEIVDNIFEEVESGAHILVGADNPFGDFCGTVIVKYKIRNNIGLFGILGPMRMDYAKSIALVEYVEKVINKK